jgi:hypothetical protein
VDRVADIYQGKARVASVDVSDPAGAQLGQKYGGGPKSMAIVFFTRDGKLDLQAPTITEGEAVMILDRLLK